MKYLFKILLQARNLWPYYLIISISSILLALSNQVVPFIVKAVADLVTNAVQGQSVDYGLAIWLAVAMFGADVAGTLLSNWGGYYGDVMSAKLRKQLSERYYQHLLTLPQSYYDNELTGTIINRLNRTISELTGFMNFFSNNFFQMILTMVFTLVIVAYYSWEVAVMLFIIYPLFLWLTGITSKQWQAQQAEKNLHTDIASGRFAEAISQIRVVKAFGQEQRELRHLQKHFQKTVDVTYTQSRQWHGMDVLRRLALNLIFFVIMAYIFWQTMSGRFTVGEMFLLIQFANLMRIPLFSMSFIVDQAQKAIAGSRDYFEVMSLQPEIADDPEAKLLKVVDGHIIYDNVTFGYSDGKKVLKGVSFEVEPNTKVALVGESGEGKSTIASLLLRLYEPGSGNITIDGANIQDVTQASLHDNVSVVFQDPAPFSGTIAENIAYAKPHASEAAIMSAAKAANAHEFISKLPDGYKTEIGERGVRLSGGQKQRLAIARALLKNSPILILDEATSSLDSRAEAQVQQALEVLMKDRTTLIIAHRLSTIAHVDKIVTIKSGKVDECGTPAELAKTGGIYAELLQLQMGATTAAKEKLQEFDIAL